MMNELVFSRSEVRKFFHAHFYEQNTFCIHNNGGIFEERFWWSVVEETTKRGLVKLSESLSECTLGVVLAKPPLVAQAEFLA